jgi:hypothetical protein
LAFGDLSVWLNGGIVWLAGSRLSVDVGGIAGQTGAGQAFTVTLGITLQDRRLHGIRLAGCVSCSAPWGS